MSTKSILVQGGDGTVIPAGMVGYSVAARVGFEAVVELPSSTAYQTVVSLSIPSAGRWEIFGGIACNYGNTSAIASYMYAGIDIDESGEPANLISWVSVYGIYTREPMNTVQPLTLNATGPTTVYLRVRSETAPPDNGRYACGFLHATLRG